MNRKNKNQALIYALNGFLGKCADWDLLNSPLLPLTKIFPIDLYQIAVPSLGFECWAKNLNHRAQKDSFPRILLGYSLGGRLALHALLQQPHVWDGAIFISTHEGLEHPVQKQMRFKEDLVWSEKFESEPWLELIQRWNSREAFTHSTKLERNEEDFSRKVLSETLQYWSLGKQNFLLPALMELSTPILWLVGEKDKAYCLRAEALKLFHPKSKVVIIPQAGHRILWDQPQKVQAYICDFLKNLSGDS